MKPLSGIAVLLILLSGCAAASQQVAAFPLRNQSAEVQDQDKRECDAFAQQHKTGTGALTTAGKGAAVGAAGGAVTGAATTAARPYGSITGGALTGAVIGAAIGAVGGGGWGGGEDQKRYYHIYGECMKLRDYHVIE